MIQTQDRCDLCRHHDLEHLYSVPKTARGLSVHVCQNCGLVQSLPRIDHVPRCSAFPDSGAGFGNIRYGKGFRTDFALKLLSEHIDVAALRTCLDVGSNRGSFLLALMEIAPNIQATAIEPDERVLDAYSDKSTIVLVNERVENVELGEDAFDLVYHCHTLEHQAHPLKSLKAVVRSMKVGGFIFLEVPNIKFLAGQDLVEEWFIDKHLYHYSVNALMETVKEAGLEVIVPPNIEDTSYITILAKKPEIKQVFTKGLQHSFMNDYAENKALVEKYISTLMHNQARLKVGAARLQSYCEGRSVAIWGAGRIYTSIVDIGGFDPTKLICVVDKNLHHHVSEMFGVKVVSPEKLQEAKPDTVLVASRLYFEEIKSELTMILPDAKTLGLDDVLAGTIGGAA